MKKILIALFLALPSITQAASLTNPLKTSSPEELIGNIIQSILGITGSVALLLFVYGGLVWMTAAGNSERVERGKKVLVWATVGLMVIFSSYAILNQIFKTIAV